MPFIVRLAWPNNGPSASVSFGTFLDSGNNFWNEGSISKNLEEKKTRTCEKLKPVTGAKILFCWPKKKCGDWNSSNVSSALVCCPHEESVFRANFHLLPGEIDRILFLSPVDPPTPPPPPFPPPAYPPPPIHTHTHTHTHTYTHTHIT